MQMLIHFIVRGSQANHIKTLEKSDQWDGVSRPYEEGGLLADRLKVEHAYHKLVRNFCSYRCLVSIVFTCDLLPISLFVITHLFPIVSFTCLF